MPDTNPATPPEAPNPTDDTAMPPTTDTNSPQDEPDTVMADVPQEPTTTTGPVGNDAPVNGTTAGAMPIAMAAAVVTPLPVPAASVAHGDATRQYLNTHVTGAVLAGLKEIAKTQCVAFFSSLNGFFTYILGYRVRQLPNVYTTHM